MMKSEILDIEDYEGVTVLSFSASSISGVTGIEELSRQVREYIHENQPRNMVIDFSQVRFLSSQVLGLLVDVWRRLGEYGGKMVISGINPQLTRVFRITSLDTIFQFCPDAHSAAEKVKQM